MKKILLCSVLLFANSLFSFASTSPGKGGRAKILSREVNAVNGSFELQINYVFSDTVSLTASPVFDLRAGMVLLNFTNLNGHKYFSGDSIVCLTSCWVIVEPPCNDRPRKSDQRARKIPRRLIPPCL